MHLFYNCFTLNLFCLFSNVKAPTVTNKLAQLELGEVTRNRNYQLGQDYRPFTWQQKLLWVRPGLYTVVSEESSFYHYRPHGGLVLGC